MKTIIIDGIEYNLTPKVLFKKGDWVVYDHRAYQVIELPKEGYINLGLKRNGKIEFAPSPYCRPWTIEDAKDGDLLVSEYPLCGLDTWYCIFKSLDGDESMTVYCYLARDGRFETKKELCFDKDPYNTKPATKEQRDTLMKAMADAGYTFDFEKKELKKIAQNPDIEMKTPEESLGVDSDTYNKIVDECVYGEQKSAWSEEDDAVLNALIRRLEGEHIYVSPHLAVKCLKSLRLQTKQEWSEEDKWMLQNILECLRHGWKKLPTDILKYESWLKSLIPQLHWKPSDEQMDALRYVTNFDYGGYKATLVSLYEQLKKLRGE